ncbi:MAG: CHAT domain-containing protein [Negativicutes bacterium]|nr:CHAT domain-containing protein [Negativicutes bacterium]
MKKALGMFLGLVFAASYAGCGARASAADGDFFPCNLPVRGTQYVPLFSTYAEQRAWVDHAEQLSRLFTLAQSEGVAPKDRLNVWQAILLLAGQSAMLSDSNIMEALGGLADSFETNNYQAIADHGQEVIARMTKLQSLAATMPPEEFQKRLAALTGELATVGSLKNSTSAQIRRCLLQYRLETDGHVDSSQFRNWLDDLQPIVAEDDLARIKMLILRGDYDWPYLNPELVPESNKLAGRFFGKDGRDQYGSPLSAHAEDDKKASGVYEDKASPAGAKILRSMMYAPGDPLGERLALNLAGQGKYAEAADVYGPVLEEKERILSRASFLISDPATQYPPNFLTVGERQTLADWLLKAGRPAAAAASLKLACAALRAGPVAGAPPAPFGLSAIMRPTDGATCNRQLLDVLWASAPGTARDAATADALVAAQDAQTHRAATALIDATARRIAENAGAGSILKAIDRTLAEQAAISRRFFSSLPKAGPETSDGTGRLVVSARDKADFIPVAAAAASAFEGQNAAMVKALKMLADKVPDYGDARAPHPVDLDALQRGGLLHDNELLIQIALSQGEQAGYIVAVTRQGAAWARLGLSYEQIATLVHGLRDHLEGGQGAADRSPEDFTRDAHVLYVALFGDPAIARLLADPARDTLIVAPSGPLVGLPFGLLVATAPDIGGAAEPDWLIRSKAIAVVPSASSLRLLRLKAPPSGGKATINLFAVADPDYDPASHGPEPTCAMAVPEPHGAINLNKAAGQGIDTLRRQLARAPLPCTLVEAHSVGTVLGAPIALLHGDKATESNLKAADANGQLGQAKVIELATHGFAPGQFGLTEPALALAAPHPGDKEDGFLFASEITRLTLNADWVILSACNTAAPDADGAGDLSGLSSAFFYAGAHALLVSNWNVNGALAAQFVPHILQRQQQDKLTRAQALRQTALDLLRTNPDPADWAVFSLIGEPDQPL